MNNHQYISTREWIKMTLDDLAAVTKERDEARAELEKKDIELSVDRAAFKDLNQQFATAISQRNSAEATVVELTERVMKSVVIIAKLKTEFAEAMTKRDAELTAAKTANCYVYVLVRE